MKKEKSKEPEKKVGDAKVSTRLEKPEGSKKQPEPKPKDTVEDNDFHHPHPFKKE